MAKSQHNDKPARILASNDKVRKWLNSVQNTEDLQQFLLISAPDDLVRPAISVERKPATETPRCCLLAGSFDPVHKGHFGMAEVAVQEICPGGCWFEICVANVDKGELQLESLQNRLKQDFQGNGLLVSNAATFVEKAELFPATTFAVGADTIQRICQLKYYQESQANFERAVEQIEAQQCDFLVFGRTIDGQYIGKDKLNLPNSIQRLCRFVSEEDFKKDVSSTEIRRSR